MMPSTTGEEFVVRVLDWARTRPDIRAVLRTGSRARRDGTADAVSDHDIELYTTDPEQYADSDAWVGALGPVLVSVGLEGPWDNPARLVFFEDGVKADFQVLPVSRLAEMAAAGLDEVHVRGYEVLFEHDGAAAALPAAPGGPPAAELPDAREFHELCAEFWFEMAHLPRCLARGELWVAKSRDWTAKELLQTMIEWHALTRHGAEHDVWYGGTRMRRWAAPGVWDRLPETFGGFTAEDILRGARATADLFAELAKEVAGTHGFPYPEKAERAIRPALDELPLL
ncbi:aminoglycoside 6-adenylyltransferase [Streptomyces sp. ET3-23]|uniref:aminoglycoside 6-adenylyltransferase n=1 Tax=Streptomyces sp. ET3-23 TaxID=2885643 RepID=UPI001D12BF62|nr:aminoglycoside 6-adenylyltransferase [Streptomyces sp. ET3-23]MCC2279931.1 aminoglycoside 6-adenylyltransferase [Streptomyces sp. ET3-23]